MKNFICKGIGFMPAVAYILMVIALFFDIADHIKSWRKSKLETADTPEDNPEDGEEQE